MQYRKLVQNGPDVSLLGYGCMRFPSKGNSIDKELTFSQMKLAYDNGVNYYDTAYPYHSGKSEVLLGEFIKENNIRDTVYIADKLPTFLILRAEQIEKFFATQLARLDTDYIDFYLIHMLSSLGDWERLKSFGVLEFLERHKKAGAIRHIGFSFHGRPEEFIKILEDYPWEFCQIQYNYLDEHNQAGIAGMRRAHELGIGVAVMEPLRGGALAAKAPDKVKAIFSEHKEKKSAAYWGMRYIMNHHEVATVLSGMNVNEHIMENIGVASITAPNTMTADEHQLIERVKAVYGELMKVPCTGCGYCVPCPFGVDIPSIFSDYNSKYFFGNNRVIKYQYLGRSAGMLGDRKSGANLCTACGKCTKHCPQAIDIPTKLKEAHKELDDPIIRAALTLASPFWKKKK